MQISSIIECFLNCCLVKYPCFSRVLKLLTLKVIFEQPSTEVPRSCFKIPLTALSVCYPYSVPEISSVCELCVPPLMALFSEHEWHNSCCFSLKKAKIRDRGLICPYHHEVTAAFDWNIFSATFLFPSLLPCKATNFENKGQSTSHCTVLVRVNNTDP